MSLAPATKGLVAASAFAIALSGLVVSAAPAQAACQQQGFSVGEVRVQATDGSQLIFFTDGGPTANGPAKLTGISDGDAQGTLVGGISGRRVDLTVTWDDARRLSYVGNVGDDGVARGGRNDGKTWVTTAITCLQEQAPAAPPPPPVQAQKPAEAPPAPKQGPTVTPKEGLAGVTFSVTDRSGVASQCTYSSEGFEKGFGLPANGTSDVFVPAVRLFKQRTGTITCDNGTSTNTSVFF